MKFTPWFSSPKGFFIDFSAKLLNYLSMSYTIKRKIIKLFFGGVDSWSTFAESITNKHYSDE
jgi:hypothetical protein